MSEITSITAQSKDKRRCNVYVDGRFYCGLTLESVVKYRLKVGQSIDAERLSEIQLESERNTALDKALTYISASQKTKREIRTYLEGKGYLPPVCEYVLEKMSDYGFADDGAYATAYAESAIKKKGKRLIEMELKRKGISDEEIDAATQDLGGEAETAKRILEKYMRGKEMDKTTLQKAYRHLMGKGFDYDTAREALRLLGESLEEEE